MIHDDDPTRPWDDPGVFRVAPGVYRMPLPMPNDGLRAVNVYAIEGSEGVTLIDSGVARPQSREALVAALAELGALGLGDVDQFLVTHMHYDHYTQALTWREDHGTPIALGREERHSIEAMLSEGFQRYSPQIAILRRYGAPEIAAAMVDDRPVSGPHGFPDTWLDGDSKVEAGTRTLDVLHTPGHTRGHMVFSDGPNHLMFGGDHILSTITPSIGFEPAHAELPLGDYMRSLLVTREVDDAILLPAHGPIAPSTHARINELLAHHEHRLDAAEVAIAEGASTAREVAERLLWTRRDRSYEELDLFNRMLAVLESGAHCDVLVTQDRAQSKVEDGVLHYEVR